MHDGVGGVFYALSRRQASQVIDYQRQIWERKLAAGESVEQILRVSAPPGYSEHHTGRAIDLTAPGCPPVTEEFETTSAFESFRTDQMVICAGVPVFSLCEHHLLPFKCEISMAYIATEHVLGLSKFARIAHKYSHRLQVQERLVHQIADEITAITDARDVAVLAGGEHLCMQMRGIKSDGLMSTSVMRGLFRSTDAREEFLTLALGKRNGK